MTRTFNSVKCKDITWEGKADCKHCLIRKKDVLANIDVEKHEELLNPIVQYCYPEKTVLYNAGVEATELFIVRDGMIKLEDTLEDGSVRIVRLIRQGGIAGLETMLDHEQPYEQTAVTVRETEVCRVPFRVFDALMQIVPDFNHAIMEQWHDQLEASEKVLIYFSTGTLRQRLARVMLLLIEEANQRKLVEIHMLQIEDIAALTGVTKESVSRILAEFKRNGLLTKSSPCRLRFDEKGLTKVANG